MTDHSTILRRLVEMQQTLRSSIEACESQAAMCNMVGAKRLAFAALMVKESLLVYSKELNEFVTNFANEELPKGQEFPLDY